MGSDDLFNRRREARKARKEGIQKQKSDNWLIVCEGTQTEPNYFEEAIKSINQNIEDGYRLKVKIVGKGMNTTSLVGSVEDLINEIDEYKTSIIPYGKIFVAFDKDSFDDKKFNEAVDMCIKNGYIPLWSNQAIEFWFLLHFNYIDGKMDRSDYADKINEYFKKSGLNYKYKKNDKTIYSKLVKYGSLEKAISNATRIYKLHEDDSPDKSESCTTVYKFFQVIDERLKELE